ncbi:ATP-grasp domain-containing protein [Pseudomonas sp. CCI3.2]|uniref:ATP-grasp domain-containing protein n=1 Tax=unclassified Pseudomonas TaxID=196821 RepID=UPI002AC89AB8|nr:MULTISPECIES: ATP-grasp domain-containing protein [unclassified Pseudomonas]MEB0079634.1 ATP-grasp domain-containing protein [Pseudomonas sp. MH10out]MEB0103424.1 ATP-grasp domain-containing protein [Pseudomonas sp. CCI3.2]MEB0132223.1 ATP-grasp domain-containing protein [Pseudomonas sp. CCI2.4]MEB0157815.1 ATP-grasp domain-containing protein [Pseudomonas sp. AH2 (2023)]MEB0169338.1 ATP-grasp domain-containing protein [Pseudomonas sp. CCC4.4]
MHVLILGARAPACLEWARAFKLAGWTVSVADSLMFPLSRYSLTVERSILLPEPKKQPEIWIKALADTILKHGIDLLIPTCEEVFYLAHGLERLAPLCRVFTSDFDLLHRLHHKGDFALLTETWPIATPETLLLNDRQELLRLVDDRYDWVFKPAYSRFASQTLIRPSALQLDKIHPNNEAPWVAQRFVAGREHCSFSLLVGGQLRAHSCYRPRYRVGRGSGIYFETCFPASIREFVEHFGRETSYTGQVGFDFIEDEYGQFHVLECNPRATSGIHLFDNQRQQLIAALSEQPVLSVPLEPSAEPRMIALAMLLFAAPQRVLSAPFWRDYAAARDVIVQQNDYGPLAAQFLSLGEIIFRAVNRRCGLLAASTADIEWNGQPLGKHRS